MFFNIFILSLVQGISEFLPVSSSINLFMASKIFNISEFSFDLKIALHGGSLIALLFHFRKAIWAIVLAIFTKKVKLKNTVFSLLFWGTIPTVLFCLLLHDFISKFNSVNFSAFMLIIFGIILYISDKYSKIKFSKLSSEIFIGICQIISVFPGISRLGICITAGRISGMTRDQAITNSLLLAIPAISGSLVIEIFKEGTKIITPDSILCVILTAIISLMSLNICIKYMKENGFKGLMWYRILLGIGLLLLL